MLMNQMPVSMMQPPNRLELAAMACALQTVADPSISIKEAGLYEAIYIMDS